MGPENIKKCIRHDYNLKKITQLIKITTFIVKNYLLYLCLLLKSCKVLQIANVKHSERSADKNRQIVTDNNKRLDVLTNRNSSMSFKCNSFYLLIEK